MGRVGGEVKVGLKSPPIEWLKFVKERRRHSCGNVGKPRSVNCIWSEQDSKEYRRFAIGVRPKREADISDLAGVQKLGRLGNGIGELRFIYRSGGHFHKAIIARARWPGMG